MPVISLANATNSFQVTSSPSTLLSSGHSSRSRAATTNLTRSNKQAKVTGVFPSPGLFVSHWNRKFYLPRVSNTTSPDYPNRQLTPRTGM